MSDLVSGAADFAFEDIDGLIGKTNDPDALAQLVAEHEDDQIRDMAGSKLLAMWKNNRQGGVTRHHLEYVRDYGYEPYRSEASEILSDNS